MSEINDLRGARNHAMSGWRSGGDGNRWAGDDGRVLTERDTIRMRLDALEGSATPVQTKILAAEKTFFTAQDVIYEAGKATLVARGQNP